MINKRNRAEICKFVPKMTIEVLKVFYVIKGLGLNKT
jgi:hypothetical protein